MTNELETAFNEIAEARSLPKDIVQEALQTALVTAYRRYAGASSAQRVEARIDPNSWRARIFVEKEVVEDVMNPSTEVTLEKARFFDPECQIYDMVMVQVEGSTKRFGRIAAQTAKQVILQRIRDAERNVLYDEMIDRQGDLITGTVQSVNSSAVTLNLGRTEAVLPKAQQIPGERYRQHDKLRTYCLEVKRTTRGPQVIVSRSHRNMLRRLLEYEVPEIYNGQVEIKSIAREAGHRSKVAVVALQEGIDPVGACVGMRGIRIQNIVKELHDEKIDVIEWNPNQEQFIQKALSPARVTGVYLEDDPDNGRTAVVIVVEDQLSLAIGREGQNARLAAKLTGWRIDIKSAEEAAQWALDHLNSPSLKTLKQNVLDMTEDVQRILIKKAQSKTIMPEEFNLLGKFADLVERHLMLQREDSRKKRREEINAVKATLPPHIFEIPVEKLNLSEDIIDALKSLESAGEIMLRFLIDEDRIRKMLVGLPSDSLSQVQIALDEVVFAGDMVVAEEEIAEPAAEESVVISEAAAEEMAEEAETTEEEEEVVLRDAFGGEILPEAVLAEPAVAAPVPVVVDVEEDPDYDPEEDEDDQVDFLTPKGTKKKKKGQQKKRQFVFDESSGQVISKKQRKGSRKRSEWDDYEY